MTTAHEEAEANLRRHRPQPGDVSVTQGSYPCLHEAFETISHDGGASAGHDTYWVPNHWASSLPIVELALSDIATTTADVKEGPDRLQDFCIGEESDVHRLQVTWQLALAHALLWHFFEDFE